MRRSLRDRKPVQHYGIQEGLQQNQSDESDTENYSFLPRRILPARTCNIRNQSSSNAAPIMMNSRMSKEKKYILKLIDIKFEYDRYEDFKGKLESILTEITENDNAVPFLEPVPQDVPYYYAIISDPMDLSTVAKKLESYTYSSEDDFFEDLNLMFENCKTYNEPGSEIAKAGATLQKFVRKLREVTFPSFETYEVEDLIVDRITRKKQILDASGHIVHDEGKLLKVESPAKLPVQESVKPQFSLKNIFPKLKQDANEEEILSMRGLPETMEVISFFYALSITENFSVVGNTDFTIGAVERAFVHPHQSSLFLSLNFLLLHRLTGVRRMRDIFTVPISDVNGISDVIDSKIEESEFNIGILVENIYSRFVLWNKTRNSLKRDYDLMHTGDIEFSFSKFDQLEIELAFYNEILFPFTRLEISEFDRFCNKTFVSVFPFSDINTFLELEPVVRLKITKALINWRLLGYQDQNITNAIRQVEPNILANEPIGCDFEGSRYFVFPDFYKECRVYKETKDSRSKIYVLLSLLEKLECVKQIDTYLISFNSLKIKKYLEAEDKVMDLRELKTRVKRLVSKRQNGRYINVVCDLIERHIRSNLERSKNLSIISNLSDSIYEPVLITLKGLIQLPQKNDNFIGITTAVSDTVISESDESEPELQSEAVAEESEASESTNNEKQEEYEETTKNGLADIMFDGTAYHSIRRSSRAKKSVQRLEIGLKNNKRKNRKSKRFSYFDGDESIQEKKVKRRKRKQPQKKNGKARKKSKVINFVELVKAEVEELEALFKILEKDNLEYHLLNSANETELLMKEYLKIKEDYKNLSVDVTSELGSWEVACDNTESLNILIEELRQNCLSKKYNKALVASLEEYREVITHNIENEKTAIEKEEQKQLKNFEIQNAPRKRSSRIQHEQEKLTHVREAQELARMQQVRKECAYALWVSYKRKRVKSLENERKILRVELEKQKEFEKERELTKLQEEENFKRQLAEEREKARVERIKMDMFRQQQQLLEFRKKEELLRQARQQQANNQYNAYNTGLMSSRNFPLAQPQNRLSPSGQPFMQQQTPHGFPVQRYNYNGNNFGINNSNAMQFNNMRNQMQNQMQPGYYQGLNLMRNQQQTGIINPQQPQPLYNPNMFQMYQGFKPLNKDQENQGEDD